MPDGIIALKATAIADAAGFTPKAKALNLQGILAFITQLFQGLSLCSTTPAQVHGAISNPTRQQQRVAERVARQQFRRNPVAQEAILHGTYEVGQQTTEQEAVSMFVQANGHAPGE